MKLKDTSEWGSSNVTSPWDMDTGGVGDVGSLTNLDRSLAAVGAAKLSICMA
jgi:hypothetical protein